MTVVRALAICIVLIVVTGHVFGQQQLPPRPPAETGEAEAGADAPAQPRPRPAVSGDVDRGRYLVERVAMCGECHSTRDGRGQIVSTLFLRGGPMPVNPPAWAAEDWPLYIPRIAGLPGYTEDQAMRLLTQGSIDRDGRQLRAPMPRFRMSQQDAAAVIAYLRSR
jgi:mono/diheme cytochrome c family protein